MKLATILGFAGARVRYLALALPLFALFSTAQAGCSSSANGGYYYGYGPRGSSGGSSGQVPPDDCLYGYGSYGTYGNCDYGGNGR